MGSGRLPRGGLPGCPFLMMYTRKGRGLRCRGAPAAAWPMGCRSRASSCWPFCLPLLASAPAPAAGGTLRGTLTGHDGSRFDYFQVDVYRADGPGTWTHAIPPRVITSWETGLPVGDFVITLPAGTYRACFQPDELRERRRWSGRAAGRELSRCFSEPPTSPSPRAGRRTNHPLASPGVSPARADHCARARWPVSAYVAPYRRTPDGTWSWHRGG